MGLVKVGSESDLTSFGIFPAEQCEEIEDKGVLRATGWIMAFKLGKGTKNRSGAGW